MPREIARVHDIVLDRGHPKYSLEPSIGTIYYTLLNDMTPYGGRGSVVDKAKPLHYNFNNYPVPGELVEIVDSPSPTYNESQNFIKYYIPQVINIQGSPNLNASPDMLVTTDGEKSFYKGRYFQEIENIRPLLPYEGDVTVEGRFGNSIRFGSTINNEKTPSPNRWSNEGEIGNPITILRNGQRNDDLYANNFDHIIEDIDKDDSSIYLCSKQQLSSFIPASFNDASYNVDIFKDQEIEEMETPNEDLEEAIEEDVTLSGASNLPPEELQEEDELANVGDEETANFDNSPTENQTIETNDQLTAPDSYEVPGTISDSDLNTTLGDNAPL